MASIPVLQTLISLPVQPYFAISHIESIPFTLVFRIWFNYYYLSNQAILPKLDIQDPKFSDPLA